MRAMLTMLLVGHLLSLNCQAQITTTHPADPPEPIKAPCETAIEKCNEALVSTERENIYLEQYVKQLEQENAELFAEQPAAPGWFWGVLGASLGMLVGGMGVLLIVH